MTQNSGKYIKSKPNDLIWSWVFAVIFLGFESWMCSRFPVPVWQVILGICLLFMMIFIALWIRGWLYARTGLGITVRMIIGLPLIIGYLVSLMQWNLTGYNNVWAFRYGMHLMLLVPFIISVVNATLTFPLYKREGRAIEITVERFLNAVIHGDENLVDELSMQVDHWGLELNLLSDYLPDEQNSDIDMGNELRFKSIGGSGLPVWFKRLRCSATASVSWRLARAGKPYNLWTGLAKTPSGWKLYDVTIMSAYR